jgi:CubicO group peptidase (beta-lactamase class C family)
MHQRQSTWLALLSAVLIPFLLLACAIPSPAPTEEIIVVQATHQTTISPTITPVPKDVLLPKDLAAFDFVIERKLEAVPLAGVTLGIRWGAKSIYVEGYGFADIEGAVPAEPSTVYRIASLTKQFVAAAIMQLVEQDSINLDEPVTSFFPEAPESWQDITIHHLLNHTSGIPDYEGPSQSVTQDELVSHLKDMPLWFEPGTQFRYGSSGYRLLCTIIERQTELACGEYLQQNIFGPLGLASTFDCTLSWEGIAQGYQITEQGLEPIAHMPSKLFGSSGLCSTAQDLLKWQQALAESQVLSAEFYQQMISPTELSDGTVIPYGYALGFDTAAIGHGGEDAGFRSWLVHYPVDDLAIVLLSNTDVPAAYSLDTLASVIADRILKRDSD